jgi:hypothetical protein
MREITKYHGLVLLILILISCDTGFNSKGIVIDKMTRLPIDSVTINIKNLDSTYTDNTGKYKIDTLIYGYAGELEVLLSKQGYKTKHINFTKNKLEKDNALIEMELLNDSTDDYCIDIKRAPQMHFVNKHIVSLVNILTMLFLVLKRNVKLRVLWILCVLMLNFTIFISFVDCSIMGFNPFNGPVFLTHYRHYPFSIKIVIPVATIVFWSIYLINKTLIIKHET